MRNLVVGAVALLVLSACAGGQLTPQQQQILTVVCKADQAAPAVVQGASTIVSVAVPQAAPGAALATAADPAVHAMIQNACAAALPGSTPAAVTAPATPAVAPAAK